MIYLMLLWHGLHWLRLKPLAVVDSVLTAGLQGTGSTVGADFAAEHLYTDAKSVSLQHQARLSYSESTVSEVIMCERSSQVIGARNAG